MLILLNDPAGVTGRQCHAWDLGVSIQANIERHLAHGGECAVTMNGAAVTAPGEDPRLDRKPCLMDHVVVTRHPQVGVDAAIYWFIAAMVLSVAVSLAMRPNLDTSSMAGKDSPNNRLTGQSNVARTYQAIPDVYGYRRCWPDLIQPSTVEYIDHIKFVTEWLCISRGKGTISDVRYAETPIGDIDGAGHEVFEPVPVDGYPELGETTLLDVLETFASDDVNGQEIPYPSPFPSLAVTGEVEATAGDSAFTITIPNDPSLDQLKSLAPTGTAWIQFTYGSGPDTFGQVCTVSDYEVIGSDCTITLLALAPWATTESEPAAEISIIPNGQTVNPLGPFTLPVDADRLRWNVVFLRGLKGTVSINAQWWQIDADGVEIPGTSQTQTDTFTADTYDQRFFTVDVIPSAGLGRYRMRFQRTTAEGEGGNDVAKLEEVYAVRHYAEKVLPGVTVIRVTTKATTEATGFSDRKFNVRWLRHVRQLASDTLGESRNFARAMAHIWTLAGNDIAELDTEKLQAINDEHGEDSQLLRFDASLDNADSSLGERLQTAANAARCTVWRDGVTWTVTREQAEPGPTMQLDYRNLAAGGESAITYAAHLPASFDGVELEYADEATQSKKAYVRLNISSGAPVPGRSRNPKKIQLVGCATTAQAENRAALEARRLLFQRVTVQDTALSDAGALGYGEVIRWIDPADFAGDDGLQAGEVLAISGTLIATTEPLDWKGEEEGRMQFTGVDGRLLGPPVLCSPADGGRVELASVPVGLYVADADRQCGSRYAFAVGLTEGEVESAGLYRVTAIKPESKGTISIAFSAYDERLYDAD